jgi:parallel beta-helix repeat protein
MKKTYLLIAGLLVTALLSCSGSNKNAGTSFVTLKIGSDKTASLSIQKATLYAKLKNFLAKHLQVSSAMASIPANVASVQITVWASDMPAITQTINTMGLSSVSVTFEVPNGFNRLFAITGSDSSRNFTYGGGMSADLNGTEVFLPVPMINLGTVPQIFYVSTTGNDTTGDGSLQKPFRTISHALIVGVNGNVGILAWPGTYNTAGGETFPLALPINTALACLGASQSVVIDVFSVNNNDAIYGNISSRIDGCKIIPAFDFVGIDDLGNAMFINNIVIDEGAPGQGANENIAISGNSSITNSSIRNSTSTDITISGNAVISFNRITHSACTDCSLTGISVSGGAAPLISNNTIDGNVTGISVSGANPTISGNKINNNSGEGISGFGVGASPPAAIVTGNSIDHNGYGIYMFSAGTSTIHNNSIYCNSSSDFYLADSTAISFNIPNNAWDHDLTTGPTITSDANGCSGGVDICYSSLLSSTPPIFSPFDAAVPGGCP